MSATIDLIIPAYNEAGRIENTLRKYLSFFDGSVQFTVVLNGCKDNTLAVVKGLQQQYPDRVLIHNIKQAVGKGGAILYGWQQSPCPILGFVDADGATPPEEFQKLLNALHGYDGAIASRFLPGSIVQQRQSPLRTVMSRIFVTVVQSMFNMPYQDTQCGAKVFRREVLEPILPQMLARDMTFDVELLYRLTHTAARIIEVPTRWIDQPGSALLGSRFAFLTTGFKMVRSLRKLKKKTGETKPVLTKK